MIIWVASYPKSGNTWIRSLLSSYLFSSNGEFNFKLLDNIEQFSSSNITSEDTKKIHYQDRISRNWIPSQKIINKDKKTRLFKTHNAMCSINGNNFTDKLNTLAVIYIVRDPRNLVMSLSHHYELDIEEAFTFLSNKRKIIFPIDIQGKKNIKSDPEDFNFLGDWSSHYNSWKNIKFCPIKIVKYEDILMDPKKNFKSILEFLSNFLKFEIKEDKIDSAITSTSFNRLSSLEEKDGFIESATSKKTKKKIKFFNLGEKNKWQEKLNSEIVKKIENTFRDEMKELNYL